MAIRAEKPGLTGVLALWGMWIVVCAATWATNARVSLALLYGVHDTGIVSAGRDAFLCWSAGRWRSQRSRC